MRAVALGDLTRRGIDRLTRAEGSLPQLSASARRFDLLLGLAMAAFALGNTWSYARHGHGGGGIEVVPIPEKGGVVFIPHPPDQVSPIAVVPYALLALASSLALIWRRRFPLSVFWLVVAAQLGNGGALGKFGFVAALIAAYSAAVYSPYRTAALGSMLVAASLVSGLLRSALPDIPNWAGAFMVLVPIMIAGNAIRRWRQRADATIRRMQEMEVEAEEATRRAVESERARIARELHDVVTHNVSVMVVQAGAARKVMGNSPDQATEALLAVEASGRAAMAELRQVMGLLTARTDGKGPDRTGPQDKVPAPGADPEMELELELDHADLAPQPSLEQLGALVGRVRDTGVEVTLDVIGEPRPVPPGIGLAAYRTVQEALTNTVKHASGAAARITVDYDPRALRLEIADTGGTAGPSAATGNGRGLIGLRERLAVYGGRLEAGRRPTGGFRVRAWIPLAPVPAGPQDFLAALPPEGS
ncbi:MAG TPA: histidine kinase [Actinocrinis sp.]|nr:histidine kinase [Actinocrinis sp.]